MQRQSTATPSPTSAPRDSVSRVETEITPIIATTSARRRPGSRSSQNVSGRVVARMNATSFGSPYVRRAESVFPDRKFQDATAPATVAAADSTHAIRVCSTWSPTNWLITKKRATKLA